MSELGNQLKSQTLGDVIAPTFKTVRDFSPWSFAHRSLNRVSISKAIAKSSGESRFNFAKCFGDEYGQRKQPDFLIARFFPSHLWNLPSYSLIILLQAEH